MPTSQQDTLCIVRTAETDDTVVPQFLVCILLIAQVFKVSALDLTPCQSGLEAQDFLIGLVDFCAEVLVYGRGYLTSARILQQVTYRIRDSLVSRKVADSAVKCRFEHVQFLVQLVHIFTYPSAVIPCTDDASCSLCSAMYALKSAIAF